MKYKIGICDQDYHYVINLMEFVNSHNEGQIKLIAFSTIEALLKYVEKGYLDGTLIGSDMELENKPEGLNIIALSDEENSIGNSIYKYQNAEVIVQEILKFLNVVRDKQVLKEKAFYAVYSPLGRSGKTTLAKGLAAYHQGALYVGLEDYGRRDNEGEEILYHILLKNSEVSSLIHRLKAGKDGVREIKGILSYQDIRQLRKDNLRWFKEEILTAQNFDRVIFDVGVGALWDVKMLETMDRIYVPVLEDDISEIKVQAFREMMRGRAYRDVAAKLIYLNVPVCHYSSETMKNYIREGEL